MFSLRNVAVVILAMSVGFAILAPRAEQAASDATETIQNNLDARYELINNH